MPAYSIRHQLVELVKDGLNCFTNASSEEIENSPNPYVKYLVKNLRIAPDDARIHSMREDGKFFKSKGRDVELYIVGEQDKDRIQEWKLVSGCHLMTSADVDASLFDHRIQNFGKSQRGGSWEFARQMLTPHYALAIADPYVFNEGTLPIVARLIERVAPRGLRGRYFVTLLGSNSNRSASNDDEFVTKQIQKKVVEPLKSVIPNLQVEPFLIRSEDFHDRYLITNNTCVFSGYGISTLDSKAVKQKESTWLAFKLFSRVHVNMSRRLFSSIHQQKLQVLANWIKETGKKTENPLFNRVLS